MQPIERFGFDAAILFSDILIVPHALGQHLEFREGEGPVLEPVADASDLGRLSVAGIDGRFGSIWETVERAAQGLGDETALIGFCGAPWTVATYMVAGRGTRDQAPARTWAYRDETGFQTLIDLIVEASIDYLVGQIEAGAQAVQLFDSWAGSLPDDQFRKWSIAPCAQIVTTVKQRFPDVPVIGFPRAAGPMCGSFVDATKVDAIGCDSMLPLAWIKSVLQPKAAVQGNLDPILLGSGGAAMEARVAEIMAMLRGGRFVFNLGHGILPTTPPEHVGRLVDLVRGNAA